jgi:hypothetical protein
MTPGTILVALLAGLAINECCHVSEWAARRLISWAVRLSYGQTPRGQVRRTEHTGNLDNCPGQLIKLCFALNLAVRSVPTWLRGILGSTAAPNGERPGSTYFHSAAVGAIDLALRRFDDIRALPSARRKEFGELTARLRELLRHPAEGFDQDSAARLLTVTASTCEAYIDDRNERMAECLATDAQLLARRLGSEHPAGFGVRRAYAHAQLQLGRHEKAEVLLRKLSADEAHVFGPDDPRAFPTRRLLNWAQVNAGNITEAEAGFRALQAKMTHLSGPDVILLEHVRCMLSWTIFRRGGLPEAEDGYDAVIAARSREMSPDHPDTLDARHSKGKMFVLAGDGPRACAILRPLLADRKRVEGPAHPNTLETRKYLAVARALAHPHSGARTHRQAIRDLSRTLRAQIKKHGPDHPNIYDTRQWLATLDGSTESR